MKKKVITIEYSLKDANTQEKLDSNVGGEPLKFISGTGQIIPGLENELIKMDKSDKSDILVQPEDGYGEINEEAFRPYQKSSLQI